MTPRTIIVAVDVPAGIPAIDLARRVQAVLRNACRPAASSESRAQLWPDPTSIEVTVLDCARDLLFPLPFSQGIPANEPAPE